MRVVDNNPCCNLYNIVKRSKIRSKMFAVVNLNTTDDDWVVFSRNMSKLNQIIFSVIIIEEFWFLSWSQIWQLCNIWLKRFHNIQIQIVFQRFVVCAKMGVENVLMSWLKIIEGEWPQFYCVTKTVISSFATDRLCFKTDHFYPDWIQFREIQYKLPKW